MKKQWLLVLFVLLGVWVQAQHVFFVYLQSEPAKPFYIRLNGETRSSSAGGYLILSRLADSTYTFSLGFTDNSIPEQTFKITIAHKDYGFLLKHFGEKGWGLFDLKSLNVIYASGNPSAAPAASEGNQAGHVSPFTDLLAKATGDPSLREPPPVARQETVAEPPVQLAAVPRPDSAGKAAINTAVVAIQTDSAATGTVAGIPGEKRPESREEPAAQPADTVQTIQVVAATAEPYTPPVTAISTGAQPEKEIDMVQQKQVVVATPPVQQAVPAAEIPVLKTSEIIRRSESSTTEGFGLVYIDKWAGGTADTIRLLIPNPKQLSGSVKEEPRAEKKFLDIQAAPAATTVQRAADTALAGSGRSGQLDTVAIEPRPVTRPEARSTAATGCMEVAAEADFFALRKQMAAADGDEAMIAEARKYYKRKCFTVLQLRNLSALFLNDEARYSFFDVSYKYCADQEGFAALEAELKDPYYVNRFKAMLR